MAYNSEVFAHRLMIIRKDRKMSQKELAESCGVAMNSIARYEAGSVIPQADSLCAIADALNCTTDQLIGREAFITA